MPNMNLKKLWRKKSVTITEYDPTYKVVYLGNVLTGWAKGECSQVTGHSLGWWWWWRGEGWRSRVVMRVMVIDDGESGAVRGVLIMRKVVWREW